MAGGYSFKHLMCSVNAFPLSGYDDAGSIEFTEQPISTATVGADGGLTISKNADNHVTVGITLKQTSPSFRYLSTLKKAAEADPLILGYAFNFYDPLNGTSYQGVLHILGMDALTFGKEPGSIKFNCTLEQGRTTAIHNLIAFG